MKWVLSSVVRKTVNCFNLSGREFGNMYQDTIWSNNFPSKKLPQRKITQLGIKLISKDTHHRFICNGKIWKVANVLVLEIVLLSML